MTYNKFPSIHKPYRCECCKQFYVWRRRWVDQLELDMLIAKNNPHHYNGELIEKLEELLEAFTE